MEGILVVCSRKTAFAYVYVRIIGAGSRRPRQFASCAQDVDKSIGCVYYRDEDERWGGNQITRDEEFAIRRLNRETSNVFPIFSLGEFPTVFLG